MQALRWIMLHGLSRVFFPCEHEDCDGVYEAFSNLKLLRCSICYAKKTARGEFFAHYKELTMAFVLIYMIVNRWRPAIVLNELNFRDKHRFSGMLDNIGRICKFAMETLFKHSLGRWQRCVADESATGESVGFVDSCYIKEWL